MAALDPGVEPKAPRFRASYRTSKGVEIVEAERLVVATSTNAAARILGSVDSGLAKELDGIEYAGVAVVSLGYRKDQVSNLLKGFGFLVPRSAGLSVLGTVWNSSLFPERAPEGHVLLTSFVGGATNPGLVRKPSDELAAQVHLEIGKILGIREAPVFTNVTVWPRAIPQCNLGHGARIATIESIRGKFPGLYFAGNFFSGPSIGACVERAMQVANEIRISFAN